VVVPFSAILHDLVACTEGATGAILTDWEGEAVVCQASAVDEYELKIIGAHQNIILNRLREMGAATMQVVRDAVITTDQFHLLIGAIGTDYMLVVILQKKSLVSLALLHLRQATMLLEKEIY
jgi:predicted regulator of Ras-like GTPase activity (Roadblock/LC7/MglB family)